MPRKAIDYQKVLIYKLVCNDLSVKDLYIGHTTDFTNRKRSHKSHCLNPNDPKYNLKVYKTIRDYEGWGNWSMIVIEKYPCNDDLEARARERHWYEVLNASMNSLCPLISMEEKKTKYNNRSKNYYDQNKDKLNENKKVYRENNKDKIKDYYVQKKDKLNEKHKCGCGGCFTTQNKSIHCKTKRHLKYIQEKELN